MMRLCGYIILLVCAFLAVGCIDEIEFEVGDSQEFLTIDGQLSDSLDWQRVRITTSANVEQHGTILPRPVPGATVTLIAGQESFEFIEEVNPGVYSWWGAGEVGKEYQLQVTLANGKVYHSGSHEMQPPVEIGSITSEVFSEEYLNSNNVIAERNKVGLNVSGSLDNGMNESFTMFRVSGEFEFQEFYPMILNIRTCYVPELLDFNNIKVFAKENLPGGEIRNERILETVFNWRFFFNYGFAVEQYSIDRSTYEYWNALSQLTDEDQTVFSPPPGTIRGDFHSIGDPEETVLGFFTVGSVALKRYFVNISDYEESVYPLCMDPSNLDLRDECYDCLLFNGSTLTKPGYWP